MRIDSRASSACLFFVVAAFSLAPVAHADLYAAKAAYEKKDHARAFALFRELAELGQPLAQESLAIMYVLGEGVRRDNVAGYAWAQIARDNDPRANVQPIIDQLEKSLTPEARARVKALKDEFGKEALEQRLLPLPPGTLRTGPAEPEPPLCELAHPANPGDYFPREAIEANASGSVLVETTVLPDGHARNPRALFALPPNAFEAAGRHVALDSGYKVPVLDGVPTRCTLAFWVRFKMMNSRNEALLAKELAKLKEGLAVRDPMAQMQYALLKTGWNTLNPENENVAPLFVQAAQAGLLTAQYSVGFISLKGRGVARDRAKGMRWLELAASAGHVEAQVYLASELLRSNPGAGEVARARDLLEKAVAGASFNGKYFLADLLLSDMGSSAPADPRRSLELLRDVMQFMENDPSAFEIRAAALSQTGDFAGAVSNQKRALSRARKMHWDVKPQEERLALYEKGQSWNRRLLDY